MESAAQESYSPYERSYRVRVVKFPGGARETLLRCVDRYVVPAGEAVMRSEMLANRGAVVMGEEALDSEARAALYRGQAVQRARRKLRWAAQCIKADRLLTCTFRENLTDRKRALDCWNYFHTLVRSRYPKWVFVAVIEHQSRGAIHFHAAVRGHQDVKYLRYCWLRAAGAAGGNVDVAYRAKRWGADSEVWSMAKIAGYMAKYIGKEFDQTPKGGRRFFGSKDRPREDISRWWIQAKTDSEAFELAFVATCGGRAIGVRQWVSGDGNFYWIASPPPEHAPCPF